MGRTKGNDDRREKSLQIRIKVILKCKIQMSVKCRIMKAKSINGKNWIVGEALQSSISSLPIESKLVGFTSDSIDNMSEVEIPEQKCFPIHSKIDSINGLVGVIILPLFFSNVFLKAKCSLKSVVLIFRGEFLPDQLLKAFIKISKAYDLQTYIVGDQPNDYSLKTIEEEFPQGISTIIDFRTDLDWNDKIETLKKVAPGGILLQSNTQDISEPEMEYLSERGAQIGFTSIDWMLDYGKYGIWFHCLKDGMKLLEEEKIDFSNIKLDSF